MSFGRSLRKLRLRSLLFRLLRRRKSLRRKSLSRKLRRSLRRRSLRRRRLLPTVPVGGSVEDDRSTTYRRRHYLCRRSGCSSIGTRRISKNRCCSTTYEETERRTHQSSNG